MILQLGAEGRVGMSSLGGPEMCFSVVCGSGEQICFWEWGTDFVSKIFLRISK